MRRISNAPFFPLASLILVITLAGCGPSGPKTYSISGSVTYNGQPVPSGSIIFTPDSSQGNVGQQLNISIENGRYDSGKDGWIGGPTIVEISGTHNFKETPEGRLGESLFTRHVEKFDAEKAKSTKDFAVTGPEITIVP